MSSLGKALHQIRSNRPFWAPCMLPLTRSLTSCGPHLKSTESLARYLNGPSTPRAFNDSKGLVQAEHTDGIKDRSIHLLPTLFSPV